VTKREAVGNKREHWGKKEERDGKHERKRKRENFNFFKYSKYIFPYKTFYITEKLILFRNLF